MFLNICCVLCLMLRERPVISCSSCLSILCFFKQNTAYEVRISDWSSDVCSSDLAGIGPSRVGYAQSLSSCRTGPGDDRRAGQAAALQNCVGARPSLKARRADAHLSRCPCPRDRGYDRPLSLSERITRSPLLALVCLSH